MHYSKALWGDDAYDFRPERWEQGAPHRQGTPRMAVSTKEHDKPLYQAVPYCQINPNGFNWGQPSVAIRVYYDDLSIYNHFRRSFLITITITFKSFKNHHQHRNSGR